MWNTQPHGFGRYKCLITHAGLGTRYWRFTTLTAVHILNRLVQSGVGISSIGVQSQVRLQSARVFGAKGLSIASGKDRKSLGVKKIAPRGREVLMLGYDANRDCVTTSSCSQQHTSH